MDSVSQFALGAAIGVATLGRRLPLWQAAVWGGIAGTLPDLDALIDHGDPVSNMTLHRAETHALAWQTLAAPGLAAVPWAWSRLRGAPSAQSAPSGRTAAAPPSTPSWARWTWMVWLALVTHALLDAMTVYGTQLALPFRDTPYGLGSIFIIDPAYTLPLLAGTGVALARQRLGWNTAGLVLSTAYLAWSALAQQQVTQWARQQAQAQGLTVQRLLVTPAPFTTLLWRIVVVTRDGTPTSHAASVGPLGTGDGRYLEGYHSLLDEPNAPLALVSHNQGLAWLRPLQGSASVARMSTFTHGFFKVERVVSGQAGKPDALVLSDLRMGSEPTYVFAFEVARVGDVGGAPAVQPLAAHEIRSVGGRPDLGVLLGWWWRRLRGEPLPPFGEPSR